MTHANGFLDGLVTEASDFLMMVACALMAVQSLEAALCYCSSAPTGVQNTDVTAQP